MSENGDRKGILPQIVVAVIVALLVGTTSPWWWDKIFPNHPSIPPTEDTYTIRISRLNIIGDCDPANKQGPGEFVYKIWIDNMIIEDIKPENPKEGRNGSSIGISKEKILKLKEGGRVNVTMTLQEYDGNWEDNSNLGEKTVEYIVRNSELVRESGDFLFEGNDPNTCKAELIVHTIKN